MKYKVRIVKKNKKKIFISLSGATIPFESWEDLLNDFIELLNGLVSLQSYKNACMKVFMKGKSKNLMDHMLLLGCRAITHGNYMKCAHGQ